jgi:hypothetical protein
LEYVRTDELKLKWNVGEMGCGGVAWINLAQCRQKWQALLNEAMKLQVPQNMEEFID